MESTCQNPAELKKPENILLGTIGAFLFSLAGAVIHFFFYQYNLIVWISGLAALACAYFGYGLFSCCKLSKRGLWISLVCAIVSLLIAEYACLAYSIYQGLSEDLAAYGYEVTISDALTGVFERLQGNGVVDLRYDGRNITLVWGDYGDQSEVLSALLHDVGLSLLLCVVGAFSYIRTKLRNINASSPIEPKKPAEF